MARGPCDFKQRNVTAAVKAVVDAGMEVERVEIAKDGKIVVIAGKPKEGNGTTQGNEWDELYDADTSSIRK